MDQVLASRRPESGRGLHGQPTGIDEQPPLHDPQAGGQGFADAEALPPTRIQERRWTKAIRTRPDAWVVNEATPPRVHVRRRHSAFGSGPVRTLTLTVALEAVFTDRYGSRLDLIKPRSS